MNDASSPSSTIARTSPRGVLPDLAEVLLIHAATTDEGVTVPAGTQGTVVGVWKGGAAYEVEFSPPIMGLATIEADGLVANLGG